MLRIPIVSEHKTKKPDYPLIPYVPRSADAYEKYNNEPNKKKD